MEKHVQLSNGSKTMEVRSGLDGLKSRRGYGKLLVLLDEFNTAVQEAQDTATAGNGRVDGERNMHENAPCDAGDKSATLSKELCRQSLQPSGPHAHAPRAVPDRWATLCKFLDVIEESDEVGPDNHSSHMYDTSIHWVNGYNANTGLADQPSRGIGTGQYPTGVTPWYTQRTPYHRQSFPPTHVIAGAPTGGQYHSAWNANDVQHSHQLRSTNFRHVQQSFNTSEFPMQQSSIPTRMSYGQAGPSHLLDAGEERRLHETFRRQEKPKRFFRKGRVFMTLQTEPLGDERKSDSHFTLRGLYGDLLYQKVRRFIVIAEAERHCLAIPISSYGDKGVANQGVNKADHGIVYIGNVAPEPSPDELPTRGEDPMVEIAIRITPDNRTEKLRSKSRIQYSKLQTIEHYVRAKSIGMVHEKSLPYLLLQARHVLGRAPNGLGQNLYS